MPQLPPLRPLSPLVVHAALGVEGSRDVPWEELGITLATRAVEARRGRIVRFKRLAAERRSAGEPGGPDDRSASRRNGGPWETLREKPA